MATNLNPYTRRKWRDMGHFVETTESFAQVAGGLPRRNDLFGFVDMLAVPLEGDGPWVYLQVTSRSNVSSRVRKILDDTTGNGQYATPMRDIARAILERGDRILVEGWWQKGPGQRWQCREREITLEEVNNV